MKYSYKKLIKSLFGTVIGLFLFVSIPVNAESCAAFYQVTATQLNVRDQASIKGNIIGILHKGDQVCIGQERGNWAKTKNGWISKKHLVLLNNTNQNTVQPISSSSTNNSSEDTKGLIGVILFIIIISGIFFALKTLFYHMLISFGMAEPDGRSKNGIRLTRLGKFFASISGLLFFLLILLIGSLSK